ncbi:MAG: zinc-ribbon domain-containing protein [Candidatus Lokiarchaeota archaeon]|nr:zinc-ribbon domain-containing protein [Candidatus Lokiarchaeota archaeon]
MGYHRIYTYNCQVCGTRTSSRDYILRCNNCNRGLCGKCAIGGLCKLCVDRMEEPWRSKFKRKANTWSKATNAIAILAFVCLGLGFIGIFASEAMLLFFMPSFLALLVVSCCLSSLERSILKSMAKKAKPHIKKPELSQSEAQLLGMLLGGAMQKKQQPKPAPNTLADPSNTIDATNICPQCGAENDSLSKFCAKCGAPLK